MKKPLWLVGWIVLIQALVVTLLVPGDWTTRAINKEKVMIGDTLGEYSRLWVSERADRWHRDVVWNSGAYSAVQRHLIPSKAQAEKSRGMEKLGEGWFAWVAGRIDALSQTVHQMLLRGALMLLWSPYMLILFIPAVFDGVMTWKIKRTNFDYVSPVIHRYSLRMTGIVITLLTMGLIAPLAVNPLIIPVAMMVCCVLSGLIFGNLQKRV